MPYFDHNATTPMHPAARAAWLEASEAHWQNPSSLYREAGAANIALHDARRALADRLGCDPEVIVFNSGATEGNNSLFASFAAHAGNGGEVWISAVEHPCVRKAARRWFGKRVREIPVDAQGVVDSAAIFGGAGPPPVLVSVMAACNETGVIQPWREIAAACRERGVPFHCDAAQWIGKMPLDRLAECDYVTGSGHKFGGPKGVGFLKLASEDDRFRGQAGGPQENGFRAGTENYPAVAAMLAALEESERSRGQCSAGGRDRFEGAIVERLEGVRIVARDADRLWNTVMLEMPDFEHVRWLTRLDRLGFQVSNGSACSSGRDGPSHVLEAMGFAYENMKRVLRVSSGWQTTAEDWDALTDAFVKAAEALRRGGRAGRGASLPAADLLSRAD